MSTDFWQWVATFIVALVSGLLGWGFRAMWTSIRELRKDLDDLRVHIAEDYVPKADFKDAMSGFYKAVAEVKELIQRLFDKLEGKADK